MKATRKVYYTGPKWDIPQIKIEGQLLREAGLKVGDQYRAIATPGQLVLIRETPEP